MAKLLTISRICTCIFLDKDLKKYIRVFIIDILCIIQKEDSDMTGVFSSLDLLEFMNHSRNGENSIELSRHNQ